MSWLRTARAGARLELQESARSRVFLLLTVLQAVSFLALVSLFGLTGSRAPMALIDQDRTHQSATFIQGLENAHHSFRLRSMSAAGADRDIRSGRLVGSITIPQGFGAAIQRGETVPVEVRVDNVNVDLTNDIQRALPAAIVWTGRELGLPGIRVAMVEHDLNPRDTEYVPYLVVSALALDGFVVAGVLGAMAVGREWERRTIKLWRISPAAPTALLAGKLLAVLGVAAVALAAAVAVVVLAYRVPPQAPLALAGSLLASLILSAAWAP